MNNKYVLNEYPRPQYVRDDWDNLNGNWNFAFDDCNKGEAQKWYATHEFDKQILVPFVYQSEASGINDLAHHENVWYQKNVRIDSRYKGKRIILHFQGSDYVTKVWVNGTFVGSHTGSSNKFCMDITNYIEFDSNNNLVVKCEDSMSCRKPRGKQRWRNNNFGCWYVQSTGIWKTVWMEYVNSTSIENVKITPCLDEAYVQFEFNINGYEDSKDLSVSADITYLGDRVSCVSVRPERNYFKLKVDITNDGLVDGVHLKFPVWEIGRPNLYDVKFTLSSGQEVLDEVTSYFGMRKISIVDGKILLNNTEIYQKLLLDQGYWPDTLLTPPSEEAILDDIDKTIKMGFNGVRKHMKVEDERYLYWCDKMGLLVWSEFPAPYEYNDESVKNFVTEWMDVVEQNYNHPSIITWVPVNESWGVPNILVNKKQQKFTEALYNLTKSMDDMRPVVVNDGWEHTVSDILTIHDYEELGHVFEARYVDKDKIVGDKVANINRRNNFAQGYKYEGQPIIVSEYGGIAFKSEDGWGYGNQVAGEEEFLKRYKSITDAIKKVEYITGYCYTQITDVQQEVNGLLSEDRTPKIAIEKIKQVNDFNVKL